MDPSRVAANFGSALSFQSNSRSDLPVAPIGLHLAFQAATACLVITLSKVAYTSGLTVTLALAASCSCTAACKHYQILVQFVIPG